MTKRKIYVGESAYGGKFYRIQLPQSLVEDLGMNQAPYLDEKGRPVVEISAKSVNPPVLEIRSVKH